MKNSIEIVASFNQKDLKSLEQLDNDFNKCIEQIKQFLEDCKPIGMDKDVLNVYTHNTANPLDQVYVIHPIEITNGHKDRFGYV